jgi:glutamyl-tRNA reductase
MTLVCVGVSHQSAPMAELERVVVGEAGRTALLTGALSQPDVDDVLVLSTCNRLEIYATSDQPAQAISQLEPLLEVASPLSYHLFSGAAANHLSATAAGLNSMALGEAQILGQLRDALSRARQMDATGPHLEWWVQQSLRIAKTARKESELDDLAPSVIGLAFAEAGLPRDCSELTAVVVGTGAMGSLAVSHVVGLGFRRVVVLSRSAERAGELARRYQVSSQVLTELPRVLPEADLVVSCTGGQDVQLSSDLLSNVRHPLTVLDLAMPHDVDPKVAELPHINLVTLASLRGRPATELSEHLGIAQRVINEEVARLVRLWSSRPALANLYTEARALVEKEIRHLVATGVIADEPDVVRHLQRAGAKVVHNTTAALRESQAQPSPQDLRLLLAELGQALHTTFKAQVNA